MEERIVPLDQLDDFKVAEGDPDVRGWSVVGKDGTEVGTVSQLLVDPAAMKVRYLDVDLADELIGAGNDRHVLIPIGYARLDEEGERVRVPQLRSAEVVEVPEYTATPVTREHEVVVRKHFDPEYSERSDEDFYVAEIYDQERFYGR